MKHNQDVEAWNKEAIKRLKAKPPDWFSYYIGNSYRRATQIGLKYVTSNRVNLLKTDLWNEGIEYQRDILGQYQDCENFNLYGMDISLVVCYYAKSRIKNLHAIQGDIRNLPFEDEFFDIILDLSTLDHIPEDKVPKVLQQYKRVLKKDSILVLIFWYSSFSVKFVYIRRKRESDTQYYFSLESIKNEVKKRFDILEEYYTGILICIPYLKAILNRLPISICNRILNFVLNLEYSKISCILKSFAGLYVLIGKKK